MASPASQSLLGHGLQARGMLLVDGVGPDERGLLGLDDFVTGLNALRSARAKKEKTVSAVFGSRIVSGGRIVTYGLAGVFFSVLDFLSCA